MTPAVTRYATRDGMRYERASSRVSFSRKRLEIRKPIHTHNWSKGKDTREPRNAPENVCVGDSTREKTR